MFATLVDRQTRREARHKGRRRGGGGGYRVKSCARSLASTELRRLHRAGLVQLQDAQGFDRLTKKNKRKHFHTKLPLPCKRVRKYELGKSISHCQKEERRIGLSARKAPVRRTMFSQLSRKKSVACSDRGARIGVPDAIADVFDWQQISGTAPPHGLPTHITGHGVHSSNPQQDSKGQELKITGYTSGANCSNFVRHGKVSHTLCNTMRYRIEIPQYPELCNTRGNKLYIAQRVVDNLFRDVLQCATYLWTHQRAMYP